MDLYLKNPPHILCLALREGLPTLATNTLVRSAGDEKGAFLSIRGEHLTPSWQSPGKAPGGDSQF